MSFKQLLGDCQSKLAKIDGNLTALKVQFAKNPALLPSDPVAAQAMYYTQRPGKCSATFFPWVDLTVHANLHSTSLFVPPTKFPTDFTQFSSLEVPGARAPELRVPAGRASAAACSPRRCGCAAAVGQGLRR
jgi:hypothetical protein